MTRLLNKETILALALFIFFSALYVYTAVPSVYSWDTGEIAAAINTLGLAHPTGFPILMLTGKLFSLVVPIGEVAFRLNLYSSLLTALSVVFLFFTFRNLNISKGISMASSFIFGFGETIWNHAGTTNVYSLSLLFVSILFFTFSKWQQKKEVKFIYWYSFVFGLSFGTHILMVSMSPLLMLMLWETKQLLKDNFTKAIKILILFIIPFLQYFYLPIAYANNKIVNWGKVDSFQSFIDYITQRDFAQKVSARTGDDTIIFFKETYKLFASEFTGIFFVLAIVSIFFLLRKNKLFGLSLIGIIVINIGIMFIYGNSQDIIGLFRYFFVAYVALAIIIAFGLNFISEKIKSYSRKQQYLFAIFIFLLVLGVLFQFKTNFASNNRRNNRVISDFAHNMLDTVESDSILIIGGDPITGPAWYLQSIGKRKDIVIISENLIRYDWYIENEAKRNPDVIDDENLLKVQGVASRLIEIIRKNIGNRKIYSIFNDFRADKSTNDFKFISVGVVNRIVLQNTDEKEILISNKRWQDYKFRDVKANFYKDSMTDNMTKYYIWALSNTGMAYARSGFYDDAEYLLLKALDIGRDSRVEYNLNNLLQEKSRKKNP